MEHHSNIVPWQMLCEEKGAKLRVAPINDSGELLLDEFAKLLGPRTKLVAVTHVSNALGTINPVKRMIELAHAQNIPVLVDGAQAVPHIAGGCAGARLRFLRVSPDTRFTGRRESACSTASPRCSKRCLRIRAAAT